MADEFLKSHEGKFGEIFTFEFRTYSSIFPENFIFLDFFSIQKSNALRLYLVRFLPQPLVGLALATGPGAVLIS